MSERSLADQIRSEASVSDRPGQLEALEAIADEVARLEAAQHPPLGYVVLAHYPGQAPYLRSADIHENPVDAENEATSEGSGPSGLWRYTVAELREVPNA